MAQELGIYYRIFFPVRVIGDYLDGALDYGIQRREIAVQWGLQDSIMERNRSYRTVDELVAAIQGNQQAVLFNVAARIESGSFFGGSERKARKEEWARAEHPVEFRIDIDLPDYSLDHPVYGGPVGCSFHGPREQACDVCWQTRLAPSMRVAEVLLERLLGLRHILRVWSGNKGYHLLCLDKKALLWDDHMRTAMLSLLQNPPPEVADAVFRDILWPTFQEQYLGENAPFDLEPQWVVHGTDIQFSPGQTGKQTFQFMQQLLVGDDWTYYLRKLLKSLYWPRVDGGPLQSHHLLKVPYSVHEKTKKISLPLADPQNFLPSQAPVLMQVLNEEFDLGPSVEYALRVIRAAKEEPPGLAPTRIPPKSPYIISVDWSDNGDPVEYAQVVVDVALLFDANKTVVQVPDHEWAARVRIHLDARGYTTVVAGTDDPCPVAPEVVLVACRDSADDSPVPTGKHVIMLMDTNGAPDTSIVAVSAEDVVLLAKRVRQLVLMPEGRYVGRS